MRDEVAQFSELGDGYGGELAAGLRLTGENAEYYARARLTRVRELTEQSGVRVNAVLDFGCGPGTSFRLIREAFPGARLMGFEPAEGLRKLAEIAARGVDAEMVGTDTLTATCVADLVYCNGVFHHIPPSARPGAAASMSAALRPGGLVCVWENSPYNPGTRVVMSRVSFDRDAILLSPRELRRLSKAAGLKPQVTEFHFVFPHALRAFRRLEPALRSLPLGGQYLVVSRGD